MHGSVQVSRLGQFGASGNSLIPAATLLQCYGSNVAAPYWEMLTYLLPKNLVGAFVPVRQIRLVSIRPLTAPQARSDSSPTPQVIALKYSFLAKDVCPRTFAYICATLPKMLDKFVKR